MTAMRGRLRNGLISAALMVVAAAIAYLALHDAPSLTPAPQPGEEALRPYSEPAPVQHQPNPADGAAPAEPTAEPEPTAPRPGQEPIQNIEELNRRIAQFKRDMASYRARHPVFAKSLRLLDTVMAPLAQEGYEAHIELERLDIERQPFEQLDEVLEAFLPLVWDLLTETLAMAESGELAVAESELEKLRDFVEETKGVPPKPFRNPYLPDSADYLIFRAVAGYLAVEGSENMFSDCLRNGSPELERERAFLSFEYRRLTGQPATLEEAGVNVIADAYEDQVRQRLQYFETLSNWASEMGEPHSEGDEQNGDDGS